MTIDELVKYNWQRKMMFQNCEIDGCLSKSDFYMELAGEEWTPFFICEMHDKEYRGAKEEEYGQK